MSWGSFLGALIPALHDSRTKAEESYRMSNEDFEWQQQMADMANPMEIKRQGEFLEGMAPKQASAYNTYQDQTYGADTQRQIDRVKQTGAALGMSPWEITGSPNAAPMPSPVTGGGDAASGRKFMEAMARVQNAKLQSDTATKIAKMQAMTQLATTAMTTGNNKYLGELTADTQKEINQVNTANGRIPEETARNLQLQAKNIIADTGLKLDQGDATRNRSYMDFAKTLWETSPELQSDAPGTTHTERAGYERIHAWLDQAFRNRDDGQGDIGALAPNDWSTFARVNAQAASEFAKMNFDQRQQAITTGTLGAIGNFLNGMDANRRTPRR